MHAPSGEVLRVIARLSSAFIRNVGDELDDTINAALRDLAGVVGANHSLVFRFEGDPVRGSNTHEWCADAAMSQRELLRDFDPTRFPYYWRRLQAGEEIVIQSPGELPDEAALERAWDLEHGFRARLFTPLRVGDELVGAVGFYGLTGQDTRWPEGSLAVLEIVGDLFSSALASRRAEAARRDSESVYRTLVETCPDAIALTALDGTIMKVNSRALEIYGVDRVEDMVGLSAFELVAPADRERARANIQRRASDNPGDVEYLLQRADGATFPGELGAAPVFGADGRPWAVVAVVRDVSERVRMQTQLEQATRMASLGTLAAGVAHEVNNPLTYVLLSIQRICSDLPALRSGDTVQQRKLAESARAALDGTERIATIVRDLHRFSHVDDGEITSCEIGDILDRALALCAHQFRCRARVVRNYHPCPPIEGRSGRLVQLFVNLLTNAAHAIDEGDFDNNVVVMSAEPDGDAVVVTVSDTGSGIPEDARARLFEPFFTTKATGVGSGLGLSISSAIVTAHGGTIDVSTELEVGTTFRVRLPLRASERPTAAGGAPPAPAIAGKRQRVLIVDDEPAICRAVTHVLEADHDVTAVHSGADAKRVLTEDGAFDVILCDLMMPDVTGMALYSWVVDNVPALEPRMIFITGASAHASVRAFANRHADRVLHKPFAHEELRATIANVL